ncbi:MAG TPA: hypothetical protein VFE56_00290 [Candidatus Binataceae bacterium]|jgi:hypothetical protein|nr:hypothetical protein [Candidatus Binataceae bacterium]
MQQSKPEPLRVPLGNLRCFRDAVEALRAAAYQEAWLWQHHEARAQAVRPRDGRHPAQRHQAKV